MKIGITCYPTYGGSGIVATELGMELALRGHEIHFISYAHPIRLRTNLDRVHYHEVDVTNYPLFAYPPYCLALAARMADVAATYDLDVLHVHYAIPHSISALLARQMTAATRRLPFITTLHGTDITLVGVEPSYFEITKFSIESSDGVTTVSDYLNVRTREVFGVQKPIETIHNFVNCDLYKPAPRPHADRPRLVHISNFRPVKRPLDCVRILHRVLHEQDVELWMVGDGPERGPAERLAHDLKIGSHCRFLGKQDRIDELLPQTDILLLPSEHEAFGLAALEAMACGVVPVATQTGGVGELVSNGLDGFLEPVGDVEAQAARVLDLLSRQTLRARMSRAARDTARARFCTNLIIPRYEKFYTDVAR
ncbi:MAG: N-acetyl-alpha-D-glucosaminyl L-malate synthase BshA [Bryobacterales bacterium]|nr:N-acetyl-alpha-D-glucosaminyl L-malate synthase BshA [Bryobacterales bacterium]